MSDDKPHKLNLWLFFFLLLLFTAAEIGLYEYWRHTRDAGQPFVPKFALVLLIFIFTIPKAFIVMTYFMHLKFEKPFLTLVALTPFVLVGIAFVPAMIDARTLAPRNYTQSQTLGSYTTHGSAHHGEQGDDAGHENGGHDHEDDSGHSEE